MPRKFIMTPKTIAEYLDSTTSGHMGINAQFSSRADLLDWLMDQPIMYRIRICQHMNSESPQTNNFTPFLLHDLPVDHHLDINMVEKILAAIIREEVSDNRPFIWKERNIRLAINLLDGFKNRHGVDVISRPFNNNLITDIPPEVVDSIGRAISKIDPKRLIDNEPRLKLADVFWSNASSFTNETIAPFLKLISKEHQIELLDDCFFHGKLSEDKAIEITDEKPNSEKWYLNAFIDAIGYDVVRQRMSDFFFSSSLKYNNFYPILDMIGGDDFLSSAIKRAIDKNEYSRPFLQTVRQILDLPYDEVSTRYPSLLSHIDKGMLFQECLSVGVFSPGMTYDNICKVGAIHCKEELINQLYLISEKQSKMWTTSDNCSRSEQLSHGLFSQRPVILSMIKAIGLKEFSEMVGAPNKGVVSSLRELFPDVSSREFAKIVKGSKHYLLTDDLGL